MVAIIVVVAALPLRARLRLRREGFVIGVAGRRIIVVLVLQSLLVAADSILARSAGVAVSMKYASEGRG